MALWPLAGDQEVSLRPLRQLRKMAIPYAWSVKALTDCRADCTKLNPMTKNFKFHGSSKISTARDISFDSCTCLGTKKSSNKGL